MTYPGNPSLSGEIQQRVLATYEHTLELLEKESREEALLGCDFILRLDPQFEPARELRQRLQDGEAVEPEDAPRARAAAPAQEPPATDRDEEPPTRDALQESFIVHLERREFAEIVALAEEHAEVVADDPTLEKSARSAAARLEAAPYVEGFLRAGREALDAGDAERAQTELDKALALDATHPGIAELELDLSVAYSEEKRGDLRRDDSAQSLFDAGEGDAAAGADAPEPGATVSGDLVEQAAYGDLEGLELGDLDLDETPAGEAAGAEPVSGDRDERIGQLLADGDAAFEQRDFQGAIDAWSRIFLIDIDHAQANQRIERARKLKAESDRRVEEILHDGMDRVDAGDLEEARRLFRRVLEIQPDHLVAREELARLEEGGEPAAARGPGAGEQPPEMPPPDAERAGVPPAATAPPTPGATPPAKGAARAPARRFALIGGVVFLLALAAGWYLWSNRDRLFPNSRPEAAATPAEARAPDPIERARELHDAGQVALAVAQLRRIPPDSDRYSEAQTLIAQWESGDAREEATDEEAIDEEALAAAEERRLAEQAELISAAERASRQGRHVEALRRLERAAALAALPTEGEALRGEVEVALAPLSRHLELFRSGDWEYVLPDLWLLHEDDPGDADVTRLIIDAYYNLGVRDLQRGYPSSAAKKFQEALALDPGDGEVERLLDFARTYEEREQDLLYRIFVKYVPVR